MASPNEKSECDKLPGRLRLLCRGEVSDIETCNAYRKKFGLTELSASEWDVTKPSRGFGDTVAKAIHRVSRGRIVPCSPCKKRQGVLNRIIPYQRREKQVETPSQYVLQPIPFTGPITRHLVYHIWPVSGTGVWQHNLDQLKDRMELFNGRRRIAIVTDNKTDPAGAVQEYLAGFGCEFVVMKNRHRLGEFDTFLPLIEPLMTHDANTVIFRAHAKGVRHGALGTPDLTVHRWSTLMYRTLLDYWPLIEESLTSHTFAGSFKRTGMFRTLGKGKAHYSGTFWWLRAAKFFTNPNWKNPRPRYWGVEALPGQHWHADELACIFGDNAGNLYRPSEFEQVEAEYAEWQARQSSFRVQITAGSLASA